MQKPHRRQNSKRKKYDSNSNAHRHLAKSELFFFFFLKTSESQSFEARGGIFHFSDSLRTSTNKLRSGLRLQLYSYSPIPFLSFPISAVQFKVVVVVIVLVDGIWSLDCLNHQGPWGIIKRSVNDWFIGNLREWRSREPTRLLHQRRRRKKKRRRRRMQIRICSAACFSLPLPIIPILNTLAFVDFFCIVRLYPVFFAVEYDFPLLPTYYSFVSCLYDFVC